MRYLAYTENEHHPSFTSPAGKKNPLKKNRRDITAVATEFPKVHNIKI